jgi:hypothetical protein
MHKYFDYRRFVAVVADTVDYGMIARKNFDFGFYRHSAARHKSVAAESRNMIDSIGLSYGAADRLAHCVLSHNQSVADVAAVVVVAVVDSETIYLELFVQLKKREDPQISVGVVAELSLEGKN